MATVRRADLPWNSQVWANWFSALGSSLITIDGTDVVIDNTFVLKLFAGVYGYASVGIFDMEGNPLVSRTSAEPITVTVAVSDSLFYVRVKDSINYNVYLIYEKTDNFTIYSYTSNATARITDIRSFTFTDKNTQLTYKHGAILNYNAQSGYINYAADVLLLSGSIRSFVDTNFITCTNINADSVITFGSQNYYAVGTNTLVMMD